MYGATTDRGAGTVEKGKTFSTRDSQVIPHLTTNLARRDLASQFGMGWGACPLGVAERGSAPARTPLYTSHAWRALRPPSRRSTVPSYLVPSLNLLTLDTQPPPFAFTLSTQPSTCTEHHCCTWVRQKCSGTATDVLNTFFSVHGICLGALGGHSACL